MTDSWMDTEAAWGGEKNPELISKMQQRHRSLTLAFCVTEHPTHPPTPLVQVPAVSLQRPLTVVYRRGGFARWKKTHTAGHRWGFIIKTILMWLELPHSCGLRRSHFFFFLQSGCMEVIWVHLVVQTGYIVNTQWLAACGEALNVPAPLNNMRSEQHFQISL